MRAFEPYPADVVRDWSLTRQITTGSTEMTIDRKTPIGKLFDTTIGDVGRQADHGDDPQAEAQGQPWRVH